MNDKGDRSIGPLQGKSAQQISPTGRIRAIPPAFKSIQANGCKTPGCDNFGVPPIAGASMQGRGKAVDSYAVVSAGSVDLACRKCGSTTTIKSNQAIHEELLRQGGLIWSDPGLRCPDAACSSHQTAAGFRKYGSTPSGSARYQCRACDTTFSIGKATLRQRQPHKNAIVFELLVNKSPFNRMREITGLSAEGLYGKIDSVYEQCRAFAADRERRLASMHFERLYLSTDRQDYLVNWRSRTSRKTIQLTAVATADLKSGYVFGLDPNFDPSISQDELKAAWTEAEDGSRPPAMRQTARLWTRADFDASSKRYRPAAGLDATEDLSEGQQLPSTGCQVHADYLMAGHYWLLRHHLQGAAKLRLFLDADAGLLGACIGAFADRIKERSADIAVVRIDKELTVDARNAAHAKAKQWFRAEKARFPSHTDRQVRSAIMTEIVAEARKSAPSNRLNDLLFGIPFPDLAEPGKRVRFVTDLGDYNDGHVANLLLKATLWPVDTVFNRIRRRLTMCERPVSAARRTSRRWHIYAPYDPKTLNKALTIFRVWHNYVWIPEKTDTTAAEKLGLAQGKIRIQDILSFRNLLDP